MGINLDAIGMESAPHESSWDSKDCLLYSLGVGAGATDPTGFELEFTTENTKDIQQKALPTMCVVLGGTGGRGPLAHLGDVNYSKMVHGEQGLSSISHFQRKPLSPQQVKSLTFMTRERLLVILETTALAHPTGFQFH